MTKEIARRSSALVVMAQKARDILGASYGISPQKVVVIPHGVPYAASQSRIRLKEKYGLKDRKVISTFGLINPGKGIEYAIEAIAKVVQNHPDVIYLVLGQTHPGIKKTMGEDYRKSLEEMVREKGLKKHVRFVDTFLNKETLVEYLLLTDIYLTPYLNKEQITSGTLAYAVGLGKAIVSTPYYYAEELLSGGRGLLCNFRDSDSIAERLIQILDSPELQSTLELRTRAFGRKMTWPNVAQAYKRLFLRVLAAPALVKGAASETGSVS